MQPPKVFHDIIAAWRAGIGETPKLANGTFRGITSWMPGYWTIVGITRNALAVMEARGFSGDFAKDLRRDHIKSGKEFQQRMLGEPTSYAEFCDLVADYGRVIVCTKAENPPHVAGYGNRYTDADIVWLAEPIETSSSIAVPANKRTAALFKTAK